MGTGCGWSGCPSRVSVSSDSPGRAVAGAEPPPGTAPRSDTAPQHGGREQHSSRAELHQPRRPNHRAQTLLPAPQQQEWKCSWSPSCLRAGAAPAVPQADPCKESRVRSAPRPQHTPSWRDLPCSLLCTPQAGMGHRREPGLCSWTA